MLDHGEIAMGYVASRVYVSGGGGGGGGFKSVGNWGEPEQAPHWRVVDYPRMHVQWWWWSGRSCARAETFTVSRECFAIQTLVPCKREELFGCFTTMADRQDERERL